MSELGDAAQECWDDLEDAADVVLGDEFARYRIESEGRGVYWAISTLCACVAIAESVRWAWANRRGGMTFSNAAGTSTSMRRTCVFCGEPHLTP